MVISAHGEVHQSRGRIGFSEVSVHEFPSLGMRFRKRIEMNGWAEPDWLTWLPRLPIERVAFHPDGRSLYVRQATDVAALDAVSGEERGRWKAHDHLVTSADVRAEPPILATGGLDGNVRIWET